MNYSFLIGILGSIALVAGAAWPGGKDARHPMRSIKNWLFAGGSSCMFIFALLDYLNGGPVFFVILQISIIISVILMMLNTPDRLDMVIIALSSAALIIWSLFVFEGYSTILFILGLAGMGLGYAFQAGTLRRDVALTLSSVFIAIFSYIEVNWIFFWLNTFFAVFSGYYWVKNCMKSARARR